MRDQSITLPFPPSLDRCIPPSPHWITTIEKRKGERERRKRRETGGIPLMERRGERERKKERARNEKKGEGGMTFLPLLSFLFRRLSNFILFLLSQHKSFIRIKEREKRKENISWWKSSEISSIESTIPNIVKGDLEINKSPPRKFAPAR